MRTRLIFSSSNPVPSKHRPSTQLGVSRESRHKAVLLHEAVDALDVGIDDIVVDATLGAAGHAKAITQNLGREGLFIGFDLDSDAVNRAEARLNESFGQSLSGLYKTSSDFLKYIYHHHTILD